MEPLIWTIPISRNTPYNTQIAIFRAEDNDEGSHGRVHFKIEKDSSGGWFRIDSRTGELFLAKTVPAETVDPRVGYLIGNYLRKIIIYFDFFIFQRNIKKNFKKIRLKMIHLGSI